MKTADPRASLIASVLSFIAFILQSIGLARYLGRLPDDWVGIALYVVTIVAFGLGTVGFYAQWRKQQQED